MRACGREPLGSWQSLGDPCIGGTLMARARTFFSQGTHVLPLPGRPGEFLFMADRWVPTDLGRSKCAPLAALQPPRPSKLHALHVHCRALPEERACLCWKACSFLASA